MAFSIAGCSNDTYISTSTPISKATGVEIIVSTPQPTLAAIPSPTPMWSMIDYAAQFNDIVVLPNSEVWIAGYTGLVVHKCGGTDCTSPNATYAVDCVRAMDFTSYDGWILACSKIYHWNGDWSVLEWKLQWDKAEEGVSLEDIGFANSDDGWVVGYKSIFHPEAIILHWNGIEWQNISLLDQIGRNDFALNAIDVLSDDNVWVVGDVVLHWDGKQWQEIPLPKNINGLESVSASNETDVQVAGRGFVLHWNEDNWIFTGFDSYVDNVLAISPDNAWVAGSALYHWNGKEWNEVQFNKGVGNTIVKMILTPDKKVWALTSSGNIYQLGN